MGEGYLPAMVNEARERVHCIRIAEGGFDSLFTLINQTDPIYIYTHQWINQLVKYLHYGGSSSLVASRRITHPRLIKIIIGHLIYFMQPW